MNTSGIQWVRSPGELSKALDTYQARLLAAVEQLVRYFLPQIESSAKAHAPWMDRTGNARQTLFTVHEVAGLIVTLYLSHGMEYGKWLELCNSGKYAIVMKTLESYYGPIRAAMDRLVRG